MSSDAYLTVTAQRLFESRCAGTTGHLGRVDPSLLARLFPDLVRLVDESHDRPVRRLAPTIRQLLLEQDFVVEGGDRFVESGSPQQVDVLAELLISVLEEVRQLAIVEGRWSDAPVTPQMFG